ncbi:MULTISPECIES: sugar transferase [unclassified Roseitalea]|uniref:sugar transferase n=1 Tax=unclassified Roseitalea TaxID=2639107 RepID=UPI00273F487B|nr:MULTISPECIES: sugar transferase [unclassified Roseitalea]
MDGDAFGFNSYALAGRASPLRMTVLWRIVFKWPMALALAVGIPLLATGQFALPLRLDPAAMASAWASAVAVGLACFGWRRLNRFPGVRFAASAIWSILLAFGAAFAFLALFAIEHNRAVLLAAAALTCLWFVAIAWLMRRSGIVRIGIIPGGDVAGLPRTSGVRWTPLVGPEPVAGIDAYLADLRHDHGPVWQRFIADRALDDVPVYHAKEVIEHLTGEVTLEHLADGNIASVTPRLDYLGTKRLLDLVVLTALSPLWASALGLLWLLVVAADGRPALFRQRRIGLRGRPFTLLKFRTMRQRAAGNGPQITRLGRFLRRHRLDELPQIVNVLRGEMTLIGPRPEQQVPGERYETQLPFYRYRYSVRPGLTGWAQVNQGHVLADADMRRKLGYDLYYIKNLSAWLDLLIAIKTVRIIVSGAGAK